MVTHFVEVYELVTVAAQTVVEQYVIELVLVIVVVVVVVAEFLQPPKLSFLQRIGSRQYETPSAQLGVQLQFGSITLFARQA
jgi:hypothetical protein